MTEFWEDNGKKFIDAQAINGIRNKGTPAISISSTIGLLMCAQTQSLYNGRPKCRDLRPPQIIHSLKLIHLAR
jgi:hypothetical protein